MGDYGECLRSHERLGGKSDGCQECFALPFESTCRACNCHVSFHRKIVKYETEVVYTKCNKIHSIGSQPSVDGCPYFAPKGREGTDDAVVCAVCGCVKGYHRNEVKVRLS